MQSDRIRAVLMALVCDFRIKVTKFVPTTLNQNGRIARNAARRHVNEAQ